MIKSYPKGKKERIVLDWETETKITPVKFLVLDKMHRLISLYSCPITTTKHSRHETKDNHKTERWKEGRPLRDFRSWGRQDGKISGFSFYHRLIQTGCQRSLQPRTSKGQVQKINLFNNIYPTQQAPWISPILPCQGTEWRVWTSHLAASGGPG